MPLRPLLALLAASVCAPGLACQAQSGALLTQVIELYTSEGCSSCPPADRWLSSLKGDARAGHVVAQAFHVGYWDNLGWVDRFASPAHTQRQREIAARHGTRTIYTPQLVRNGRDSRDYAQALAVPAQPAQAVIRLTRSAPGLVVVEVTPVSAGRAWAAYWTTTEHDHESKVSAGENRGEGLRHDFVVRQYATLGQQEGPKKLLMHPLPPQPGHAQQFNMVVVDPETGAPLQALSLECPG